jgi:hypothetical protein
LLKKRFYKFAGRGIGIGTHLANRKFRQSNPVVIVVSAVRVEIDDCDPLKVIGGVIVEISIPDTTRIMPGFSTIQRSPSFSIPVRFM